MWRDPRLLILLVVGSLTTMVGGVVAPILPEMIQQLDLDPALAGNLVSAHCLTIAIFSPPLGIIADRVGKLQVLLPSLVLYALFGVVGAFVSDFWLLLLIRGLLGAASGGIAAASLGILGNMYEGQARSQALGLATSSLTIAGIITPLLGGWVGANDWRYAFYIYGVALPLAFLAAAVFRKKPLSVKQQVKTNQNAKLSQTLGNLAAIKLLAALSLTSVAMYAVVIYAPLYLEATVGAGPVLNGIVLAARAIGAAAISAFGASKLVHRWGAAPTIALGFGLMAVTLALLPSVHQLSWILFTAVVFGVGFGIVLPSLYGTLTNLAPAQLRSSVLSVGIGVGFLGQFLSPIILGPVVNFGGLEGVFYAAASVTLVAGLLFFTPNR